ncbi:hypothetical protein ABZ297_40355 [Nonomuraea sp. NPDC005983]|uniref:hypothetical protein n=1 Tax=Nonomuraea sp. NPDC005983 TaxID=3155595 RepID=UPI0033AA4B3B
MDDRVIWHDVGHRRTRWMVSQELRFDHASLDGAGRHLQDAAALFRRHTDNLLAAVHGTGGTAFGGSATGMAMDQLSDLLHQACGHLHGNLHLTGDGLRTMADDLRAGELDAEATVHALDQPDAVRKA